MLYSLRSLLGGSFLAFSSFCWPQAFLGLEMHPFDLGLDLHMAVFPLCLCISVSSHSLLCMPVQISPFCKNTRQIGVRPTLMTSTSSPAKTPFPNKATFSGTGAEDFGTSFSRKKGRELIPSCGRHADKNPGVPPVCGCPHRACG